MVFGLIINHLFLYFFEQLYKKTDTEIEAKFKEMVELNHKMWMLKQLGYDKRALNPYATFKEFKLWLFPSKFISQQSELDEYKNKVSSISSESKYATKKNSITRELGNGRSDSKLLHQFIWYVDQNKNNIKNVFDLTATRFGYDPDAMKWNSTTSAKDGLLVFLKEPSTYISKSVLP